MTLRVFFDLTVDEEPLGRIVFRLRPDIVPLTSENFRALCTGEKGYGYKGSAFHRIVRGFLCQGGDFGKKDGTGGASIYKGTFDDENFILKHTGPGILSMANSGPNSNGSQFFITTRKIESLDDKNVVFGEVIEGMEVLRIMDSFGSEFGGKPDKKVVITDCGEME